MAGTQRYWDGTRWSDHVAPMPPSAAHVSAHEPEQSSTAIEFFGILFAIFIPFIGFVIGLTQINKKGNAGIAMILISVVSFIVWLNILSS